MEDPESSVTAKPVDATAAPRERPSIAAQVRESMKAIDAERSPRVEVVAVLDVGHRRVGGT